MIEITNQQRDTAFEAATAEQKFLYESPDSGALLWQLASKHELTDPEKYYAFVMVVGDVILGIEKQSNIPTILSEKFNISVERSIKITGDIIDFLNHPINVASETEQPLQESTVVAENSSPSLESEIAETEAALNAIPKMRTMVHDAQESTAKTSSQDDLLNTSNRWTPKNK